MNDKNKNLPAETEQESTSVKAVEKLGGFLSNVFGIPITTSVGMLQDKLAVVRWERQLRLADRVREITHARAISGQPTSVPPRLAVPIIENASLEEDNYLQDLWAHLLSAAMNSETNSNVRNAFVDIIKQLEPIDVKILELCYKKYREGRARNIARNGDKSWYREGDSIEHPISQIDIVKALEITPIDYKTAVDNLIRTRLLASYIEDNEIQSEVDGDEQYYEVSLHYGYHSVCMTQLGVSFVLVCTPSSEEEDETELIKRLKKEEQIKKEQRKAALQEAMRKIQGQFGDSVVIKSEDEN